MAFGRLGKEKPRHRFVSAKTNRFRGEVAPSVWVTNPRARTLRRGGVRIHNIHHAVRMSSESEWKSMRIHGAQRTGLTASGSATRRRSEWPFLAALRPCGVFYSITYTWLYHRLLDAEKRFTRCQKYANETKLY